MTTISVVIPSYNRAELLKLTVQSVLAQTIPPTEVIIVDDGSTDHTQAVCATFPPPVRYIRQKNSGVAAARNTGIRAVTGEWIAFCDSDDLWMTNKLALQLAAIDATGVKWSITDFAIINGEGARVMGNGFARAFPIFPEKHLTAEQHFGNWLGARTLKIGSESMSIYTGDAFGMMFLGNVVIPSTSIIAQDLIRRVGAFDETLDVAEDTEYFHRMAARAPLTILMKPLTDYRMGHPSLIAQKSENLIGNALISHERATLLRSRHTIREEAAIREGGELLRVRLAFSRLAALNQRGAREALRGTSHRYVLSMRAVAILLASLLPSIALRGLHWAKRGVRSLRG